MQTTGNLVGPFIEFTSGVEHGQYDLQGRFALFLMNIYRDTSAIVDHCDGIVRIDDYVNVLAKASQCLVDGVINHLINQMMETLFAGVAYVHGWSFPYRL